MPKMNKKILGILACAGTLASTALVTNNVLKPKLTTTTVKASTTSVAARSYGVDVASYQSSNLSNMATNGAQFAIVKVSEGTSYRNPKASAQISSALSNNLMPMAYHFATFGANSSAAVNEANYAVSSAQAAGLPSGAYIACDWESGQGNNINGGKTPSANAILAFMDQIKAAGYQPLLYSSASWLRNNIDTSVIGAKYPNALWVASYASNGRIDQANFNNFPSMDNVAIWQFTDNWRGLNVDGNISLLPLSMNGSSSQAPASNNSNSSSTTNNSSNNNQSAANNIANNAKPEDNKTTTSSSNEVKTNKTLMRKAYIYDKDGNRSSRALGAYRTVTVLGRAVQINGKYFYKIGDNQYIALGNVDGTVRTLHHNAYVYNNRGYRVYTATLRRGGAVRTYGTRFHINGKSYYRIAKNRYVKVGNFK